MSTLGLRPPASDPCSLRSVRVHTENPVESRSHGGTGKASRHHLHPSTPIQAPRARFSEKCSLSVSKLCIKTSEGKLSLDLRVSLPCLRGDEFGVRPLQAGPSWGRSSSGCVCVSACVCV